MARFKVWKRLEATWDNVEAPEIADAGIKARKLVPNKQRALGIKITRLKD